MLEVEGIGFGHAPGQWLFREVSFAMAAGQITAVLGPNGRGKTTLVRCVAGLLRPREGVVRRSGPCGFVPQAAGMSFAFDVIDVVLMGRANRIGALRSPSAADYAAAEAALDRVGCLGLARRPYVELSGGQRQLVLIARAIASGNRLLVLDEPASALDLRNQTTLLAMCKSLAGEGYSILMTTHHPDHASYLADRVVLMHQDRVSVGSAEELVTAEEMTALYRVPVVTTRILEDGLERTVVIPRYGS